MDPAEDVGGAPSAIAAQPDAETDGGRFDPPDENEPAEGDDESFENAAPADSVPAPPRAEFDQSVAAETGAVTPPSLESVVPGIPVATRDLLAELFKAHFTSVRRIGKDQLR